MTTFKQASGPQYSRILGIGGVPRRERRHERRRRRARSTAPTSGSDSAPGSSPGAARAPTSDVLDLSEQAARLALDDAGLTGADIDVVLVSTVTYFHQTPAAAAIIADRIGATPAAAYDISAACAGYSYGVGQADALVRSGLARHVLVIGAEKMSDFIDPTDRSISFLLGDGAGAAVIGPSDTPGIGPTIWGSDGGQGAA